MEPLCVRSSLAMAALLTTKDASKISELPSAGNYYRIYSEQKLFVLLVQNCLYLIITHRNFELNRARVG